MSSDTFNVRVVSVDGPVVVLDVQPTTAGGLADMVLTRSFVLGLAEDRGARLSGNVTSEDWMRENVDRFVESTEVLSVTGLTSEDYIRSTAERYRLPLEALQPVVRLRATFRDAAMAALFAPGQSFGTTQFDWWWHDPRRPQVPNPISPTITYERDPAWREKLDAALTAALAPHWTAAGPERFARELGEARWVLRMCPIWPNGMDPPELSWASLKAEVPVATALRPAPKKKPVEPFEILSGQLKRDADEQYWFFRPTEGGGYESAESMARDLAAALARVEPVLARASTREAVLAFFEAECAVRADREKVPNFAPLRPGAPPELPPELLLSASSSATPGHAFWLRAVLLRAFGDEAGARAATAQASGRWKRMPKDYQSILGAAP